MFEEHQTPEELRDIESQLAALSLRASGIDRDLAMFRLGQQSRPVSPATSSINRFAWAWPAVAATLAFVSVGLGWRLADLNQRIQASQDQTLEPGLVVDKASDESKGSVESVPTRERPVANEARRRVGELSFTTDSPLTVLSWRRSDSLNVTTAITPYLAAPREESPAQPLLRSGDMESWRRLLDGDESIN